ncbi:glucosaminidase domain-containing protein [Dyella sp. M7H15-1]|uniref:glycoside hydrolase family 73 protein n=1 Tax=Dyella sp. M7H15-1 TaxID=2501295 RepID=UPI00197AD6EC|nr:glucosaminidase domain-containing protein [Dyella sp. M7H15-1]
MAIAPAAQASMHATRVPASFVVSEGALESGWGTSALARDGCNLFGVKADASWKGGTLTMRTREFLRGQWVIVPASWRKYANWSGCMADHASFLLNNPRYKPAFEHHDGESFARAVAAAGYATDPQYTTKIIEVIRAYHLAALDLA